MENGIELVSKSHFEMLTSFQSYEQACVRIQEKPCVRREEVKLRDLLIFRLKWTKSHFHLN